MRAVIERAVCSHGPVLIRRARPSSRAGPSAFWIEKPAGRLAGRATMPAAEREQDSAALAARDTQIARSATAADGVPFRTCIGNR